MPVRGTSNEATFAPPTTRSLIVVVLSGAGIIILWAAAITAAVLDVLGIIESAISRLVFVLTSTATLAWLYQLDSYRRRTRDSLEREAILTGALTGAADMHEETRAAVAQVAADVEAVLGRQSNLEDQMREVLERLGDLAVGFEVGRRYSGVTAETNGKTVRQGPWTVRSDA